MNMTREIAERTLELIRMNVSDRAIADRIGFHRAIVAKIRKDPYKFFEELDARIARQGKPKPDSISKPRKVKQWRCPECGGLNNQQHCIKCECDNARRLRARLRIGQPTEHAHAPQPTRTGTAPGMRR